MSKIESETELEVIDMGSQEDFIEHASNFICEEDNSIVITQYENALKIIRELEELPFVNIIDMADEDNEGYEPVVIRNVDEVFLITDLIDEEGFFKYITADYILCEDLLDEEDLNEYIDAREEFYLVDYDLDDECNCEECCNCCGCNDEIEGDEKHIIELILSYLELIKDNDYKDEAILQAFMEVLEKLGVIEIED